MVVVNLKFDMRLLSIHTEHGVRTWKLPSERALLASI